jgi:hypothetical protein
MITVVYNNSWHLLVIVLQIEHFTLIFYIDLRFQIIIINMKLKENSLIKFFYRLLLTLVDSYNCLIIAFVLNFFEYSNLVLRRDELLMYMNVKQIHYFLFIADCFEYFIIGYFLGKQIHEQKLILNVNHIFI